MNSNFGIIIFVVFALFVLIHQISLKIKVLSGKAKTYEAKLVSRKKATDRRGVDEYFVTFEFINGNTLELKVPIVIYDLASEKNVTGKLTFEPMKFIRFIRERGKHLSNSYQKSY